MRGVVGSIVHRLPDGVPFFCAWLVEVVWDGPRNRVRVPYMKARCGGLVFTRVAAGSWNLL